jgi:hypothetical protein
LQEESATTAANEATRAKALEGILESINNSRLKCFSMVSEIRGSIESGPPVAKVKVVSAMLRSARATVFGSSTEEE